MVLANLTHDAKGWPEPYIYTIYYRIIDAIPAKNTVCYVWVWPTLLMTPRDGKRTRKRKKEKTTQAVKATPHIN